ncbi:hypothetical protein M404DRAFT_29703 [Pisolithus tinctorius Marx 270]|uniref:Uncharacterized protein n=1 Tax=Pisolithus tinctorius Marx 270 TaxID=870435 RepID=A0A0C3NZ20_PISTI|nr:hypothetical protein M404DRAFT_29703 [Pisolithus tinctorius Marx 270]
MNKILTTKLQEAPKLQKVKPVVVEELLMMKVPIEFKVPVVSEEDQQLADESLVSKIPLKFEAERLEEQVKPTSVKVEELEMLAGSPEVKRLEDEEVVDSHRMPVHESCQVEGH